MDTASSAQNPKRGGLDCACLNLIDTATARRDEVTGVIVGLGAKNAVQWVTGG